MELCHLPHVALKGRAELFTHLLEIAQFRAIEGLVTENPQDGIFQSIFGESHFLAPTAPKVLLVCSILFLDRGGSLLWEAGDHSILPFLPYRGSGGRNRGRDRGRDWGKGRGRDRGWGLGMRGRLCAGVPLPLEHCNAIFDAAQCHKILVIPLLGLLELLGLEIKRLVHFLDCDVEILKSVLIIGRKDPNFLEVWLVIVLIFI